MIPPSVINLGNNSFKGRHTVNRWVECCESEAFCEVVCEVVCDIAIAAFCSCLNMILSCRDGTSAQIGLLPLFKIQDCGGSVLHVLVC